MRKHIREFGSEKKKLKFLSFFLAGFVLKALVGIFFFSSWFFPQNNNHVLGDWDLDFPSSCIKQDFEQIESGFDLNSNGIDSQVDFLNGALARTQIEETYLDKYYVANGGKPPENEGVCTDLIWRAFEFVGLDFQNLLYQDMQENKSEYPLHIWQTDLLNKNIDFRRVPNLDVYFQRYGKSLTTELVPCDFKNLNEWQAGDIVVFSLRRNGFKDHIAVVSNKRDERGVPYLIHNWGIGTVEDTNWFGDVMAHYRVSFGRLV
jgi:uncharacterized protein